MFVIRLHNSSALSLLSEKDRAALANGNNSSNANNTDKDKSFGKLSHYLAEMKKELDVSQKQRKETQLEMLRLRERCQQLEDRLALEQSKTQGLEERLERSKASQKTLQAQVQAQTKTIEHQQQLLEANNHRLGSLSPTTTQELSDSQASDEQALHPTLTAPSNSTSPHGSGSIMHVASPSTVPFPAPHAEPSHA